MMVLDPEGQILSKSAYIQQAGSFLNVKAKALKRIHDNYKPKTIKELDNSYTKLLSDDELSFCLRGIIKLK
jgi:hypothetical protein